MQTAKKTIEELQFSDPEYRRRIRQAMQPYFDHCSKQLAHIYNIMPLKLRITAEGFEQIIDPEWQALIDKVKEQQDADLRRLFPECYR